MNELAENNEIFETTGYDCESGLDENDLKGTDDETITDEGCCEEHVI